MGDPACFLSDSCLVCGRYLTQEHRDRQKCVHCGEPLVGKNATESAGGDEPGQVVEGSGLG